MIQGLAGGADGDSCSAPSGRPAHKPPEQLCPERAGTQRAPNRKHAGAQPEPVACASEQLRTERPCPQSKPVDDAPAEQLCNERPRTQSESVECPPAQQLCAQHARGEPEPVHGPPAEHLCPQHARAQPQSIERPRPEHAGCQSKPVLRPRPEHLALARAKYTCAQYPRAERVRGRGPGPPRERAELRADAAPCAHCGAARQPHPDTRCRHAYPAPAAARIHGAHARACGGACAAARRAI